MVFTPHIIAVVTLFSAVFFIEHPMLIVFVSTLFVLYASVLVCLMLDSARRERVYSD